MRDATTDDDGLGTLFACARPQPDFDGEHALAEFEARVFDNPRPLTVSRYVLRRHRGAGAHGTVYEAYDPKLDRKVAIKLLRATPSAARRTRLTLEARALARLAHPNVVAIHDVGTWRTTQDVFIVMELVDGTTLARWLAEPRAWKSLLHAFVQAGRGLEAAHAAGIVHCDFKAANVLIGSDGRVRVSDFGLATTACGEPSGDELDRRPRPRAHGVGTPGHMAPELWADAVPHASTDQYAFCVAMWSALYGGPPFAGRSMQEMIEHQRGSVPTIAVARGPRVLRRVLARGLEVEPARRWRSMSDLLAALERIPRRRQRTLALLISAVAATTMGAVAIARAPADRDRCRDALAASEPLLDDRVHGLAAATVGAAPFERDARARAAGRIDATMERWWATLDRVCGAEPPAAVEAAPLQAMVCLQRSHDGIVAAVEALERPGADAVAITAALPEPRDCLSLDELALHEPAPVAIAPQVAAFERDLARSAALLQMQHADDALEIADTVARASAPLQHAPLSLSAELHAGEAQLRIDTPRGVRRLRDVARGAFVMRNDAIAVQATLALAYWAARDGGGFDEAVALVDNADALVQRAELPARFAASVTRARLAVLASGHRDREIVELFTAVEPMLEDDATYERCIGARSLARLGQIAEAERVGRAALAAAEAAGGPSAVDTLGVQVMLAGLVSDTREGEHLMRDALARVERDIGRHHEAYFAAKNDLANVLSRQGDDVAAERLWQELAPEVSSRFGPASPEYGLVLNNLASVTTELGRPAEAVPMAERALAIRELVLPATHFHIGATLDILGTALVLAGRHDEGQTALRRAIELWTADAPRRPRLAEPLLTLARSELELGRAGDAILLLERARAIVDDQAEPWPKNEIELAIARALFELGRVDEARACARRVGLVGRANRFRVEPLVAWLLEHEVLP